MNRSLAAGLLVAILLAGLPAAGSVGATDGADTTGEAPLLQPGVSVEGAESGVLQANETDDDNDENETVAVPKTVPDGNQTLAVRLPYADRSLAGVADSRSVTLRETETALSMTATKVHIPHLVTSSPS